MLLRIRTASTGRALAQVASRARPAALRVREMSGPVKVSETGLLDVIAPYEVARTEPLHEMGVLYPPGTPSPMEAVLADGPVIVDGVMAKTGGGPTGHPIEYIRLSQYDPTPVSCKYSGIEFVSQLALDYVANKVAHQAQSAPLGSVPSSAPAPPQRTRLAALSGPPLPGRRGRASGRPASASGARTGRLPSRAHRLLAIQAAGVSGESESSVPEGVWPPGGPSNLAPPPKTLANNTFGAASEDGRYGQL